MLPLDETPNVQKPGNRKSKNRSNNTCAPSSKVKRLQKQLAGIMSHLERNPFDQLSRARVAKINELLRQ